MVTIFGESAGASAVDRLVLSPPKPIPFRAAIEESGSNTFDSNSNSGPKSWAALVKALNCTASTAQAELTCVRAAEAVTVKSIIEHAAIDFGDVVDNITTLATPVNRSLHQTVPVMMGSNADEGRLFTLGETNLTEYISTQFNGTADSYKKLVASAYPLGSPGIQNDFDAIAKIYTDFNFQCPAAAAANESALAGFPTWRYYFNATFPNENPNVPLAALGAGGLSLGAFHTTEIQFVFGNMPPNSVRTWCNPCWRLQPSETGSLIA